MKYKSDLIEYLGISKKVPKDIKTFREVIIQKDICIEDKHPSIDYIVSFMAEVVIEDYRIITTPRAVSIGGDILTGFQINVDGYVKEILEYAPENSNRYVTIIEFIMPFTTSVVMPENFRKDVDIEFKSYIMDMNVKKIEEKRIFKCINFILNAECYF